SSLGFNVVSSDDSPKMCEVAMKRGCKNVKCEGFMDLNAVDDYNMVWAMSSLALAQPESLPLIISKVYTALKPKGIFFMNLRYENEEPLKGLLGRADLFQVLDLWGCKDSRTGRDVHWQNAVLRRK
ncbi:MAG: class I SAM-dependent methyltransferase, partial [Alphaproteobacteria bacterium]|nr:class I SAM-dependent methyltransferase [Alphaproteobacteria bacterium]